MTTPASIPHLALQAPARAWFELLRDRLCEAFTAIERDGGSHATFTRIPWDRPTETTDPETTDPETTDPDTIDPDVPAAEGGGGVMSVMRGQVFEKVGVNVSTVFGTFTPEFAASIPGAATDRRFWASGISVVAHPTNPHAPTAHMNTRLLVTTEGWFGGGGDLTPMLLDTPGATADRDTFHASFRDACDRHDPAYYERFSEWCDRYFFLPHRNETRGVGGIFYDRLRTENAEADFAFTRDVGAAFLAAYPAIVRRRHETPYGPAERERQLLRRGRYVEFNLLHDRGTIFGLKTGGNVDAILMSLPPEAKWP